MIPIEDLSIRAIYQLEISSRPHLRHLRQRELLPPVVARAKRKLIDHFRAKAEEAMPEGKTGSTSPIMAILGKVLLYLLFAPNLWSATYYVDQTGGLDTNSGLSTTAAWKTVSKVSGKTFLPGDFCFFKSGEIWREQLVVKTAGTSGNQITFGAYGSGSAPIITGANLLTGWAPVSAYSGLYSAPEVAAPAQIFEDGARLTRVTWVTNIATTYLSMSAGTWTLDNPNDLLYVWGTDGASPAAHVMEKSPVRTYAIAAYRDYVTIQDLSLKGAASNLDLAGTGLIAQRNEISYASAHGMRVSGNVKAGLTILVSANTVHHNGAGGIAVLVKAVGTRITGNTVYRNGQIADASSDYSGGIRVISGSFPYNPVTPVTDTIVEFNTVYENGIGSPDTRTQRGGGIWFDTVGPRNIIRHNTVYGNRFGGIKLDYDAYGSEVSSNLVYLHTFDSGPDTATYGWGINASYTPKGCRILNNVVFGNRFGIFINGSYPAIANDAQNVEVKNNVSVWNSVQQLAATFGAENGTYGSGNVYLDNSFGLEATKFIQWGLNTYVSTYSAWETAPGNCGTPGCSRSVQTGVQPR